MNDTGAPLSDNQNWNVTEPCYQFMREFSHFFGFLRDAAQVHDDQEKLIHVMNKLCKEAESAGVEFEVFDRLPPHDPQLEYKGLLKDHFISLYGATVGTLLFCGTVDRFLLYMSGLIELAFSHHTAAEEKISSMNPNVRKFLENVSDETAQDVLANQIAQLILDRGTGFGIHEKFWSDAFGIRLGEILEQKGVEFLKLLIGIRNVHVHNRGILNRRNAKYIPEHVVGEKIELTLAKSLEYMWWLMHLVAYLDEQIPDQLRLPKSRALSEDPVLARILEEAKEETQHEPNSP
jgi:hypothetical protein